ncbi:MAG: VWA domain-containing protein [Candidatus Omnitrophica bacterium]|nr:VWA domain-containing protein [Candidatus Omnitrophota bacterium]
MEIKSPYFLLLLPLLALAFYFWCSRKKDASFQIPSATLAQGAPKGWKARFYRLPVYLRWIALVLLIVALSGPRKFLDETLVTSEGIDIVLALDVSGSMSAEDFMINGQRKNRLDIIKSVVKEFVDKRVSDRIGVVIFGSRAYTVCPLTNDYNWLKANLSRVRLGVIEDGTAIGSGISSSLLRLKDSKAKSRIIILLTDGSNNAGRIDPMTAAEMARTMGVKVYTIGAGTKGLAPMPVQMFGQTVYQNVQVDLQEEPLQKIAQLTGARYFRATDTEALRQIYQNIDALEKTKIETKGYRQYQELFWILVLAALGLVAVDILLANTLLLKLP